MSLENEPVTTGDEAEAESTVQPLTAEQLKNIVEGALFAAGKPMTLRQLAEVFAEDNCPSPESIKHAIEALQQDYQGRGVQLQEVASGFRFQVDAELAPWVGRMWEEKPARYSRALLETLALIAYRQPITRGEIEDIRGVSVSTHITKTLLERDWIRIVGHRDVPGRPAMYGTTRTFLDYFNLSNLDQLPSLAEIRDLETIGAELELLVGDTNSSQASLPEEDSTADPTDEITPLVGDVVAEAATEFNETEASKEQQENTSQEPAVADDSSAPTV